MYYFCVTVANCIVMYFFPLALCDLIILVIPHSYNYR